MFQTTDYLFKGYCLKAVAITVVVLFFNISFTDAQISNTNFVRINTSLELAGNYAHSILKDYKSNAKADFTPNTISSGYEIAIPLYKQILFIVLLFLAAVAVIILVIRMKINNIIALNLQLEELLIRKTKEIADSNFQLQKEIDKRIKAETDAKRAVKSKNQFLANMSHEIRTPMNAIIGFTDLLSSLVKENKQLYYLNSIRSSGQSLLILINDILDLSKIEAGHFNIDYRPINLAHLFEELKQVFALKCDEKDLLFEINLDETMPPSLIMSEIRMRQVLVNLIGNALKFTEKGKIELHAKVSEDSISENLINLLIEVRDTGIGIEAEQKNRIFQAFHQTEGQDLNKYGGTGLGLSISKRLVELMGGSIEVESEYGLGSTFKIFLNNIEISNEDVIYAEKQKPDTIHNLNFKPATLMVVDDSVTNRSLIVELFNDTAITVIEAGNGQVAVEKAINLLPDLILMDIRMPVLNGFEAVKLIRNNKLTNKIPVFALTASISDEYDTKYSEAGFNHVLLKPVDINVLLQKISLFLPFEKIYTEIKTVETSESLFESNYDTTLDPTNVQMALNDLKSLFPSLEKMKKQKFINEILLFAKQIDEIGKKYSIRFISNYAHDLNFHTENFDTEKMEKTLINFPNLIVELEKHINT